MTVQSSLRSEVMPLRPLGRPIVYLVDDEAPVRDALALLLRTRRLVSDGFASAEAFEAMLASVEPPLTDRWPDAPSCLLLDMRMPGISGLTLYERLLDRGLGRELPVIFLTGHADVPTAVQAVKRGAFDFIEKPFSNNDLVDRVEQALETSRVAIHARNERHDLSRRLAELSEREREVLELVIDGRPNKLIAKVLDISVRTVEVHRARLFEKMRVKSAVDLANRMRELR